MVFRICHKGLILGLVIALAPPGLSVASAQTAARAQNYTFAFRDADVAQVAEEVLGNGLGVSYTVDPSANAKVSFRLEQRLTPAGLLQAFENALATNGLVLVRQGESILITTREKARTSGGARAGSSSGQAGYRVVPAQIGSAVPSEVAKALQAMGSGDTVVMTDDKTGVLMIGGTAREVEAAQQAIKMLGEGTAPAAKTRWITLQKVSATTVAKELETMLAASGLGKVQVAPLDRLNGLMLFARTEEELDGAAAWIARLDVTTSDDGSPLWIYRPKNVSAEALSETLNSVVGNSYGGIAGPASESGSSSSASPNQPRLNSPERSARAVSAVASRPSADGEEVRFAVDRDSNTLIISASPSRRPQLEKVLTQIDVTPRQILIEASVLEVTLTDEFRFGVDWSFLRDNGQVRVVSSGENGGGVTPAFPGFAVTYLSPNLRAAVDALGSKTDVQVVSAPKIVALDNRTARLQIGDQVPIAIQTAQSTVTDDAPRLVSVEYKNTGVILEVTPRITGDDSVTLLVAQEVSSVARTTTSGIDSPTIQQRRFDSSLLLKSGGTVALGGLISTSNTNGDTGIPLLSRLPGVGALFKTDTREKRRTELIVLLTARILPDGETSAQVSADLSADMKEMGSRGLVPRQP